jgi:hypothetical protein
MAVQAEFDMAGPIKKGAEAHSISKKACWAGIFRPGATDFAASKPCSSPII